MNVLTFVLFFLSILNGIDSKSNQPILAGADLGCQKITAYYNGTFKNPDYRYWVFDATLQVKFDINLQDKHIYFKVDNFSKVYAESYGFTVFNDKSYTYCYTGQSGNCTLSFKDIAWFRIWFEPSTGEYIPDLIHIDPLTDNKFVIQNAVGKCGTSLKNNYPWGADPNGYKSCFCCGDVYNPDPSLDCPKSPWS